MRFTVRPGTDPIAQADGVMLRALGLPSGGIVAVGATHMQVHTGEPGSPTELLVGPESMTNAGVANGESIDVVRVILPQAELVRFSDNDIDARHLYRALQGRPVTVGDRITIDNAYTGTADSVTVEVLTVVPGPAGVVAAPTRFASGNRAPSPPSDQPTAKAPPSMASAAASNAATAGAAKPKAGASASAEPAKEKPEPAPALKELAAPDITTIDEALLAGLDNELDMLTGWLALLGTDQELSRAWKLPRVAGVLLEGPNGCGKSELVAAAAERSSTTVNEVDISRVFKPDSLLEKLSAALNETVGPRVIFVDRLEMLTGDDALSTFRTQFVAVLRWFLDEIASKPKVMCVLGVASVGDLHESLARSELLPRTITIPPPDLARRKLLFQAAFGQVPSVEAIDYDRLASQSSGFSGADVLAAVVHASALVAGQGSGIDNQAAITAVNETTPSLGSVPVGEITNYGFEKVANLVDVKQRLTEAVIWPLTQPERFEQLGIDPPKGILLYGPPGTGKTFVVKALAHEAASAFFSVKGAELLDKYVGESERAVREVFSRARDAAPSIIFFDEFDALAPTRGGSSNSGVSDRVVAQLLTEIDGVGGLGHVAVIAASNRKDLIDPALLRAGRFETHIEIGLPEASARLALLNITDVHLDESVNREELAERTEGLSFADLTGVLREAALAALRADSQAMSVTWEHLDAALELFKDRRGEITYE